MGGKAKARKRKIRELRDRVRRLEVSEQGLLHEARFQDALYRIAASAGAVTDMREFYAAIHGIVGELMYAANFFIALYDEERQTINFPYYVDEVDLDVPDPNLWEPMGVGNAAGLTGYLLRTGESMLLGRGELQEFSRRSDITDVGAEPVTWLGVPLRSGDRTVGALVVQSYREGTQHDAKDEELLVFVAQHIAAALERTRLIDETRHRNAELSLVNEIGQALSQQLDVSSIIELVGERLREIFSPPSMYLALLDPTTATITFPYNVESGTRLGFEDRLEFGPGLTSIVLRTGEPLVLGTWQDALDRGALRDPTEEERSYVGVPILVGGRAVGVIGISSVSEHAFGEDDVRLLTTLASATGAAIENARLFQESRRRADEMAALADLGREVGAMLELDAVMRRVAERAQHLLHAESLAVYLESDPASDRLVPLVALGTSVEEIMADRIQLGEGIIGDLASRGAAEVVNDMARDVRAVPIPGTDDDEGERLMAAPLLARGRVIGMTAAWRIADAEPFTEEELGFLVGLSQQAAIAIENARLFQEATRASGYFASLVEISPAAVVTMDREQIVSGWNPAATRLFGYTPEEAIGRSIDDLVVRSEELMEEGRAIITEANERGRAHRVTRRMHRDGHLVEVEISIVPLIVEGEHQGYYAIYHDISELQEARRAADAANEAKSAFLAATSHEIRTPMNAIIGMSGLLAETELDAEQREYAATIATSGEALLAIINDILDFSKIEAGKMELEVAPFDLRGVIESVVELIGPMAGSKGLEVTYAIDPGTPEVAIGDASRLRQILLNLLNNAVKFTEQGEIVVTASAEPGPKPDTHTFQVAVRDTGIGVAPDRVDRLFRSFSQADVSVSRKFGGTGLGLAISSRLAELMDGTMWVASEGVAGNGSTFHVTFVAGVSDMQPVALGEDASLAGRRALVVDDNTTNRTLITAILTSWGIGTVGVAGAAEARTALQEEPADGFDFAVLDMLMPEVDGLDLAIELREMRPELPLILASSIGRRDVTADPRWGSADVAAVLAKPIKASSLHSAIATALGTAAVHGDDAPAVSLDPALATKYPLRILLAEDNVVNQKLAIRLLEKMGYRADVAGNGIEALEALERQEYDLLLSDVQMPEMDGLEATRRILARWPETDRPWIVAMTAEAMEGDRERCLAAGMNDYITKPIRIDALVSAITRTPRRPASERGSERSVRPPPEAGSEVASAAAIGSIVPDVLDQKTFRRFAESVGGADDPTFVHDLIVRFRDEAPQLVAALETGVRADDATGVRRAAHTLKSNAETFGATALANRCRRLEEAASDGDLLDAPAQVEGIAGALDAALEALAAVTNGSKPDRERR